MTHFKTLLSMSLLTMSLAACGPAAYTPETAIAGVKADPTGIVGKFEMTVRRVDRERGWLYLDSAQDYRDSNTLIVAVSEDTAEDILRGRNQTAQQVFLNRKILVTGLAKKIPIALFDNEGAPTGKSYDQTQVFLGDSADLEIVH